MSSPPDIQQRLLFLVQANALLASSEKTQVVARQLGGNFKKICRRIVQRV